MRAPLRVDRAAIALGSVVATAYFLLGAAWPLALGAGLLVCVLKLTLDLPWRPYRRRLPPPDMGSAEALWLERAGRALQSIRELRRSARSESIAQRCAGIAVQAEASVATLRRLAYQASVVSRLARSRENTGAPGLGPDSVAARKEATARLANTQHELHARIEGSVLGLEGLVARLAQIVALSETEELGRTSVHALIAPNERGGQ
jgi:hypothetical protein